MKVFSGGALSRLVAGAAVIAASPFLYATPQAETSIATQAADPAVARSPAHDEAHGKPLPVLVPAPPYADKDRAAAQPTMQSLGLEANMDLAPLRERADRRVGDYRLQALVGQMEHLSGDRAAAEERYQRAVRAAGKSAEKLRHVLWSRGWARLYSGDNEGALLDWRDAARLHGGKPAWYPYTTALAYWRADQRALGMQWFEASTLAEHPYPSAGLPDLGLPMIAQSLIGDMFGVRNLRAQPDTLRLPAGAQELEFAAYIASPPPKYPSSALTSGRQGKVVAYACVDARGDVRTTHVAESSGHAVLDKAATDAIAGWQFRPVICGGKPSDTWVTVPIQFAIGDGRPSRTQSTRDAGSKDEPKESTCPSGVGLDAEGFTAVVEECWTHIVCTADAVWAPAPCAKSKETAADSPR